MVDTLKEAEDRIREAMNIKKGKKGSGFSPKVNSLRQTASRRKPALRKLPVAR